MFAATMEDLSGLVHGFISNMDKYSDARTKDYLFLQGMTPLLVILCIYVFFSVRAGPKFMKHREPFKLKKTIIAYNVVNIAACVWLVNELLQSGWLRDYNYSCQAVDYSDNPNALRMARATWVYFVLKLVDLLDTVFFVLRKKDNQVTHLHVYHHTTMPILGWLTTKFVPGGHGTFGMLLNTGVHVIMYGYYLLSALGPQYQKYLWWKKYLTTIQIVQFVIILLHHAQLFVYDCGYPKAMAIIISVNVIYNLYMFSLFFIKLYSKKPEAKES